MTVITPVGACAGASSGRDRGARRDGGRDLAREGAQVYECKAGDDGKLGGRSASRSPR